LLLEKESNVVTPLNIIKGLTVPKTAKNEINIKEGVVIRDLKYKKGESIFSTGSNIKIEPHNSLLKSLSFRNQLPYTVKRIQVLFILFDKTGTPIDYFEGIYFSDGIKPFLAKTLNFGSDNWLYHKSLVKEPGENLEVRILDFEIVNE
jgi:hypothetical protein